jgi:hypothetical protein
LGCRATRKKKYNVYIVSCFQNAFPILFSADSSGGEYYMQESYDEQIKETVTDNTRSMRGITNNILEILIRDTRGINCFGELGLLERKY